MEIDIRDLEMDLAVIDTAFHRNGVGGAPFHVVLFHDGESRKVGIVFGEDCHVAVLDVQKLASGDIASRSNSWRGDNYEWLLRRAVDLKESQRPRPFRFQILSGISERVGRVLRAWLN